MTTTADVRFWKKGWGTRSPAPIPHLAYDTLNRISLFEEKATSAAPACAPGGSTPCRAYGYDNWSNQFVSQANVVTRHSFTCGPQ